MAGWLLYASLTALRIRAELAVAFNADGAANRMRAWRTLIAASIWLFVMLYVATIVCFGVTGGC